MYHLRREVWLLAPITRVFPFFSDAVNLASLTPGWLKFKILTPPPIKMRAGAIVDYQIRIHGIPIRWKTEIEEWDPPHGFVDRQLSGPYRFWRHTHRFESGAKGTLCIDDVEYLPRGGALTNWLLVRRDVNVIFGYRERRLKEMFGSVP
jgi:ligand-binding SRPBCC domain-containing protein